MNVIKQIQLIERIDQLIHMKATGSPIELCNKLEISKTKLYRIIHVMRKLNAPVVYNVAEQSFVYEEAVGFKFGFFQKELCANEINPFIG